MENGAVSIWMLVVIGGPVVLGAVLAFGVVRSRWRRRKAARGEAPPERTTPVPRGDGERRDLAG